MKTDKELREILNKHRSETWATGWNNNATEEALKAITEKWISRQELEEAMENLPYVLDTTSNLKQPELHIKLKDWKTFRANLLKKGEDND